MAHIVTMIAKPRKTLELHFPVIHVEINFFYFIICFCVEQVPTHDEASSVCGLVVKYPSGQGR